jgi:hypothetical protein
VATDYSFHRAAQFSMTIMGRGRLRRALWLAHQETLAIAGRLEVAVRQKERRCRRL